MDLSVMQLRRVPLAVAGLVACVGLLLGACGGSRGDSSDSSAAQTTILERSAGGATSFGTLPTPCGSGEPAGAPDQAVDETSITIGFGDDAGFTASPGVGHEGSDAVRALIDWCNDQGGINGRTVKGIYYDAKITELNNVMAEACSQVFMLVGVQYALGSSGEQTRIECGLPSVPGTPTATNAPLMVTPVPMPIDEFNVAGLAQIAQAHPGAVKKTVIMEPNFPSVLLFDQQVTGSAPTVGWRFLDCTVQYPITGVSDYRPLLQRAKDCGATAIFTTDQSTNFINMLDAANQIDFHPLWLNISNIYTKSFADSNVSGNADGVYFADSFVPLDFTPEGSANQAYTELVRADGGDVGYVGQSSASAFLLWATAVKACGNDLTRGCVMQRLRETHAWDGGGLHAVQDPGANTAGSCQLVMQVDGHDFEQAHPSEEGEFACDPEWSVAVNPPPDAAASMNLVDRIATQFTPPIGPP